MKVRPIHVMVTALTDAELQAEISERRVLRGMPNADANFLGNTDDALILLRDSGTLSWVADDWWVSFKDEKFGSIIRKGDQLRRTIAEAWIFMMLKIEGNSAPQ